MSEFLDFSGTNLWIAFEGRKKSGCCYLDVRTGNVVDWYMKHPVTPPKSTFNFVAREADFFAYQTVTHPTDKKISNLRPSVFVLDEQKKSFRAQ